MSNYLEILQKQEKDEDENDEDYIPEIKKKNKIKKIEKLAKKEQKEIEKLKRKEKIDEIWKEMNEKVEIKPKKYLKENENTLKLAEEGLKQKSVFFAGQEYIVEENGELRSKKEIEKMKENKLQENQCEKINKEEPTILTQSVEEVENKKRQEKFKYLNSVLSKISQKSKSINSILKSKIDWKNYSQNCKMDKQFEQNRKNGYLEKKNFINKSHAIQNNLTKKKVRFS